MIAQFYQRFPKNAILNYWLTGYIFVDKEKQYEKTKVVIWMKQEPQAMECSGSLTPELEGAGHTAAHPKRAQPAPAAPQTKQGGAQYE